MDETARVNDALGRLRAVFRVTADAELTDSDLAEIAGLDEEECRALLKVLLESRRDRTAPKPGLQLSSAELSGFELDLFRPRPAATRPQPRGAAGPDNERARPEILLR